MEKNEILRIEDLRVVFPGERGIARAVDGLNLYIQTGETLGLVGESGCGKSMSALSILRLIPKPGYIEGGAIFFEGRDLLKLKEEEMRKLRGGAIAMIFQEPMTSLNPVLKIGHQVSEAIKLHQKVSEDTAWAMAIEELRRVGIPSPEDRMHEYPHQLSGGLRQRVMIAMAVANRPRLLIADEPTTALDVTIQAQIVELMEKLKEEVGMSILLISHDLGLIGELAQRVSVMYTGRIVEEAPFDVLYKKPSHPYTKGLIASMPRYTKLPGTELPTIKGQVPPITDLPSGCKFRTRCERAGERCKEEEPPLDIVEEGHLVRCWYPY